MERLATSNLIEWKNGSNRKPLILRGARQVGKTYLVRAFAKSEYTVFWEINFERDYHLGELFLKNNPLEIINNLEIHFSQRVDTSNTLLFLDEIQEFPEIYQKLRYFYEEMPMLSIIVAGSLLDFIFKQADFSVPVGRLSYLNLAPLTFNEFLLAKNETVLLEQLKKWKLSEDFMPLMHDKAIQNYYEYCLVGGMPEAVKKYIETNSFIECEKIKGALLNSYQEDFYKYAAKEDPVLVRKIFKSAVLQVGNKIKYSIIDPDNISLKIARILKLFENARLFCPVYHSSCNQIPLGSETNLKQFKYIFLDSGLYLTLCGVNALEINNLEVASEYLSGKLFEQLVGMGLLSLLQSYEEHILYYWLREKKSASAEVDFVITYGKVIIPVEAKAGKAGRLKSLHYFVSEKENKLAIRINTNLPNLHFTKATLTNGNEVSFHLLSIPIYLIESLPQLINQALLTIDAK